MEDLLKILMRPLRELRHPRAPIGARVTIIGLHIVEALGSTLRYSLERFFKLPDIELSQRELSHQLQWIEADARKS